MSSSVGRMVSVVAVGGMATIGLVGLATPAGADERLAVEVTPREVRAGGTFTISGGDCLFDGAPGRVSAGFGPLREAEAPWGVDPDADGRWTMEVDVPMDTAEGSHRVDVVCRRTDMLAEHLYEQVALTVTAGAPALTLSTTTVAAGGSFVVRGGRCIPDGHVQTAVKPVGSVDTVAVAGAPVGDDPNWEASLTIPSNAAVGRYGVTAVCREAVAAGDMILFAYQEAEFEVTAAAPASEPKVKAVRATPRYTG